MSDPTPREEPAHLAGTDGAQQHIGDLIRGAFVNAVGKLGRVSRALSTLVISNLFGAAVLGIYRIAWDIVLIAYKVGRLGLHRSVTAAVVQCRADGDVDGCHSAIGRGLALGLVFSLATTLATYSAAPHIAAYLGKTALAPAIGVMVWALPFMVLTVVLIAVYGFLSGRPDFLDIALVYVLINFIATIAVTKYVKFSHLGHPEDEYRKGDI